MNKTLIRAAAVITLVAASITFFACSGDDGSAGPAGASCEAKSSITISGGIDIVCGGVVQQTIPPAPGTEGTCSVTPIGATGSFNVTCGGNNYVLGGNSGGGGCTVSEDGLNNEYVVFNCGGTPTRLAKAWCGSVVYNPSKQACKDGELTAHACGGYPWDMDVEFCANDGRQDSAYTYCGFNSLTGTNIEYDPKTSFCWSEGSAEQKVEPLCGAAKEKYDPDYFCQERATGNIVMQKCQLKEGGKEDGAEADLVTYEETEICDVLNGRLLGSCNNIAYEPKTEFCQTVGTAKRVVELCKNDNVDTNKFDVNQFCGKSWGVVSGKYAKVNKVYNRCGPTPELAKLDGGSDTTTFDPLNEFCVQVGAIYTRLPLCFVKAVPEVGQDPDVEETNGEYVPTSFCQVSGGFKSGGEQGKEVTVDGVKKYDPDEAAVGEIVPRCGLITSTTAGAERGAYPDTKYCNLSNSIQEKLKCPTDGSALYNPEIEFCSSATGSNVIYSTCRPRSPASAQPPYDVNTKVCDRRNNKLYDFTAIGGKRWLLENVNYAGTDGDVGFCYGGTASNCDIYGRLYNNSQAVSVCAGIGVARASQLVKAWGVPEFTDFDNGSSASLLKAASVTDNLKKVGAGIWTPATAGTDEFKFAALPGGKASYSPTAGNTYEQSGIAAYWWTSTAAELTLARSHNKVAAITYNSDNFDIIIRDQTTGTESSKPFEANKSSEFLSVRCVSATGGVDGISATCSLQSLGACDRTACDNLTGATWDAGDGECVAD